MFNKIVFFTLVTLILGCSNISTFENTGLKIFNYQQGLMKETQDRWVVYSEGDEFNYTNNAPCVWGWAYYNCMWIGYTFEYELDQEQVELNCVTTYSKPTILGNPKAINESPINMNEYTITLNGTEKRHEAPGYLIDKIDFIDVSTKSSDTKCYYKNKLAFNYKKTVSISANK